MRPTAEMYERVASSGRKRPLGLFVARRPAWAMALAALLVLALAYTLVQLSPLVTPGAGQAVAQVPQRTAFVAQKGAQRGGPPPGGKGSRAGPTVFEQLVFQVRGADALAVRSADVLAPPRTTTVLTSADSYRLVLELAAPRQVYVYQQVPAGALALLYPNEAYGPVERPVPAAETVYLPAEPNGLYLDEVEGQIRLYVVAAEEPVPALETLVRYSQRGIRLGRRKSLARLQEKLDAIAAGQVEGASGWVFEFEVR
jgi:hypothetical protein